jgi:DNA-binding beta-propeller fold protein YncE
MDWYAGNILSVTGEYYGVEKTIEKEFEVFKNKSGASSSYGTGATDCAHVSPVSVQAQEAKPKGIAFSKSGEKMFIVGNGGDGTDEDVDEYTLTGAYCIGTATYVDSFDISSEDIKPNAIIFSKSGEKMFIVGNSGNDVNEYILTAAWDVSTASFVDNFKVNTQDTEPEGIRFNDSGEKMFIVGNDGKDVSEYTLTAAWDVSSATYVDSFDLSNEENSPKGIAFSKSGEKMFIVGNANNNVHEYILTAAWDVSSASFVDSFSVNSQETAPRGIWFDSSGKTMFIVGVSGDDVNVYKLTTAWDVSTASFVS